MRSWLAFLIVFLMGCSTHTARTCEEGTILFNEISKNELKISAVFYICSSNERNKIIEGRVDEYFDKQGLKIDRG